MNRKDAGFMISAFRQQWHRPASASQRLPRFARNSLRSDGFTIVELMVAMSVLSVILVMSTVVLLQVGKLYSKGVNAANAQNAARNIMSDISGDLQFSGKAPFSCTQQHPPEYSSNVTCAASRLGPLPAPGGGSLYVYAYCIDTTRYSYILDHELASAPGTGQTYHVLWRDTMTSNSSCQPLDITKQNPVEDGVGMANSGSELVPVHMRLTRFDVEPVGPNGTIYALDVWVAYGDDDLLHVKPDSSGGCATGIGSTACAGYTTCNGGAGQEYCADSLLSTTISRRLE